MSYTPFGGNIPHNTSLHPFLFIFNNSCCVMWALPQRTHIFVTACYYKTHLVFNIFGAGKKRPDDASIVYTNKVYENFSFGTGIPNRQNRRETTATQHEHCVYENQISLTNTQIHLNQPASCMMPQSHRQNSLSVSSLIGSCHLCQLFQSQFVL